jgi:gamma-glutamylcyclotransferase (GGCT)/AIG2-like uncharacterized protein YtfP
MNPDDASAGPGVCLAIYGTLAPGKPNHHQLSELAGQWRDGIVRGRLAETGWGAALGYPGLILDPDGGAVPVKLLFSDELPRHWARLDAFEGPDYRRVVAPVETGNGVFDAHIYVLARPDAHDAR